MNYPAAELRSIKMNFYLINPDAEHRGILLIKNKNDQIITFLIGAVCQWETKISHWAGIHQFIKSADSTIEGGN